MIIYNILCHQVVLNYRFVLFLQVTSTVVLSTLLSAPLMFISAQMCLLDFSSAKARNFEHLLKRAMIDVSGTAIPFAVSINKDW